MGPRICFTKKPTLQSIAGRQHAPRGDGVGANMYRLRESQPIAARARTEQTHAPRLNFAGEHRSCNRGVFAHALFRLRSTVVREHHHAQRAVF